MISCIIIAIKTLNFNLHVSINEPIDVGVVVLQDSVDTVEELLKKQEDFEKMLAGQEERFLMLNRETKARCLIQTYKFLVL